MPTDAATSDRAGLDHDFLAGGGELAELIRGKDWSRTPLGAIDQWPQSLRTTVSLCLASSFPINIIWGPEGTQIYNDRFRVVCGDLHPRSLGSSYAVTWASAWPVLGGPYEQAISGTTSFIENERMFVNRNGYLEETFFTFSLSPVRDESGGIGGLYAPVVETTVVMLTERRTRALRELTAGLAPASDLAELVSSAVEALGNYHFDLPFLLFYQRAPAEANYHLTGYYGVTPDGAMCPLTIDAAATSPWPAGEAIRTRAMVEVHDLRSLGSSSGPYEEGCAQALVVPLTLADEQEPPVLIVLGISPRLPFDDSYRGFLESVATSFSAALTRVRAREDERRLATALAQVDRAKTEFFSNVSHEFRTPLTLLLGPLEQLAGHTDDLPEADREPVLLAHRNALRLLKLVNTLLDFSRIEAGRSEIRRELTDIGAFTAELASNFRSAIERAGLQLIVDIEPVPPVHLDREMWEKIVLNLISNAFKFTHQGTIRVLVRASAEQGAGELVVSDTGIGISQRELPLLFDRFHRVEGAQGRSLEGSGIGLSLARELVKLHGGNIAVASEPGRGSTFTATIPLGPDHLEATSVATSSSDPAQVKGAAAFVDEALSWLPRNEVEQTARSQVPLGSVGAAPGGRVLLAEDNADMRGYITRLLEAEGLSVEAFGDGEAALAGARRHTPELILSDVMMPKLGGFELLAAVRADPTLNAIPFMMLSARAGEEARAEGIEAGADDYLIKPFSAREMVARVAVNLGLARDRREAALRALRESEARFRALATVGASSVYRMSPDWREMRHLDGAAFLSDTSEATVDWIDTYIPPDERMRVREAIYRAIATKGIFELEHRVLRADGSVGWTFSRAMPLFDDAGEISEWFGAATDATDRVRAGQSFTRLFQASPAPFLVLKPDSPRFTILEVNDAYLSATMRTRDDIVGQGVFDAYPNNPSDETSAGVDVLRASLERVLVSRQPDRLPNLQYDVARPDGTFEKRWWSPINSAVLDDDGEVEALIHNANDVTEERWAAIALQGSEEKYRSLFETMGQGYALVELVRDTSGKAVDQRYLTFNPAIERLLKISAAHAIGKLASEVFPAIEPWWTEAFDRVVSEGKPNRIEHYFGPMGRWFEVYAYPAGGDRFVTLYEDTTDRKRAEAALRENQERQAFLLKLSDALRPLVDAADVQGEATRLLREHFDVGWCYYLDYSDELTEGVVIKDSHRDGLPSLVGTHDLSDIPEFIEHCKTGEILNLANWATSPMWSPRVVEQYSAMNVKSLLGAPLLKQGRLRAMLIMLDTKERGWSEDALVLIQEVSERTWAAIERARAEAALRENEERLRQFGEASQDVLWIRDAETLQWVYLTPAFEAIYGLSCDEALTGENFSNWQNLILPEDRDGVTASIARVQAGENATFEYRIRRPVDGAVRWLRDTDFPIFDSGGKTVLVGGVGHDFTDVREAELRLQTLIEGMPQLVWRAVEVGKWNWASPQWTAYTGQEEPAYRGQGWLSVVHPGDHVQAREAWSHAMVNGGFEVEYRVKSIVDGEYRWFKTRAAPVRDHAGNVVEWLGTSTDIHDLRDLQERQKILVAELQHRTRNLMGVVRSMGDKTARASADLPDFRDRFRDRLDSLARTQGLLSRLNDHDRVSFDELVGTEVAAMNGSVERVTVDGPAGVRLRSSTVQTLAMALHELATNATKYGALNQSSGRLAITWRLEPAAEDSPPLLHIDWLESGVTMPSSHAAPTGTGQGRELIERALPYQLNARTTYDLGPDGVHCTIAIPVSAGAVERENA